MFNLSTSNETKTKLLSTLKEKNMTMSPEQPVCTTVLYQHAVDEGKETVFWIPTPIGDGIGEDKWNKSMRDSFDSDTYTNPYLARNSAVTYHGLEHIQRAGLQKHSKHGVFHTLGTEQRTGGRIAITSRVSHSDSCDKLSKFLSKECNRDKFNQIIDPYDEETVKYSVKW